jgi:peptidoglycan hydrolase CwlO-like protein
VCCVVQGGWQAVLPAWPVILSMAALLASPVAVVSYFSGFATKADVKDSEGRVQKSVEDSEGRTKERVQGVQKSVQKSVESVQKSVESLQKSVESVQKSVESVQKSVDRLTIGVMVVLVVGAFFVRPKYTK